MNLVKKATITIEYDRDDAYTQLKCTVNGLLEEPTGNTEDVFYMMPGINDTFTLTIARAEKPDIEIGIRPILV